MSSARLRSNVRFGRFAGKFRASTVSLTPRVTLRKSLRITMRWTVLAAKGFMRKLNSLGSLDPCLREVRQLNCLSVEAPGENGEMKCDSQCFTKQASFNRAAIIKSLVGLAPHCQEPLRRQKYV